MYFIVNSFAPIIVFPAVDNFPLNRC